MCLFAWKAVVLLRPKFNSGFCLNFFPILREKKHKKLKRLCCFLSFHQQRNKFSSPFACKHDRWTPNQIEFEGKVAPGTASSVDLTVVMEINVYPAFPFPPHGISSVPFSIAKFINHRKCAADVPAIGRTSRRKVLPRMLLLRPGRLCFPSS